MSVPVGERRESRLEVFVQALDLVTYTLRITKNEKIFLPEYQRQGFHRFERFGKKSNQCSEGAETPGKHEVVRGNDEETGIKESSEGSGQ